MDIQRIQKNTAGNSESGFGLVELVIALTILAVGIMGVVGVMESATGVATKTTSRSRAVELASEFVEATRSQDTATLWTAAQNYQQTSQPETFAQKRGALTYDVERAISVDSTGKYIVAVVVSWTDASGLHRVTQTSAIYTTALAAAATTTLPPADLPTAIADLIASLPGDATGGGGVNLYWPPITTSSPGKIKNFIVRYSPDKFQTYEDKIFDAIQYPDGVTVGGLSPGTEYSFEVQTEASDGLRSAWSKVVSITTAVQTTVTSVQATVTTVAGSHVIELHDSLTNTKQASTTLTVCSSTATSCS